MADQKTTQLTELTTPDSSDELMIVDKSDTTMAASGTNKRIKFSNIATPDAVLNSDTSTTDMQFVIDEDDMVSDSATKVPTQQSVRAYADAAAADAVAAIDELANGIGTQLNTSVSGFTSVDQVFRSVGAFTSVGNTTTETSMLGGAVTLNLIEGQRNVFTVSASVLNNSGSTRTVTVRMKVSGVTILTWAFDVTASASQVSTILRGEYNIQNFFGLRPLASGLLTVSDPAGTGNDIVSRTRANSSLTVTNGDTFDLTVQFSAAHANLTCATVAGNLDISRVAV